MKRLALPLISIAFLLPLSAHAHDAWLLPSATTFSGDKAWLTVDAAVGNDKFFFNHRPLQLKGLEITGPSGASIQAENLFSGELRSGFDLQLTDAGTYRIALVRDGVSAQWKEAGKTKRWFGPVDEFEKSVPRDASELKVQERASRVETFVTKGKPTDVTEVKRGIGLQPLTHPNDLFAGESAEFIMTVDGNPAKQVAVEIVPEGSRYRDQLKTLSVKSDDEGRIRVTWPHAGRYWLAMDASIPATAAGTGATLRVLSYSATLEVLPQ